MQWTLFSLVLMGQFSFSSCHRYQYHFIGESRTWDEAQKFCRETYTDLATVSDMTDMKRLSSSTENQVEAWIGLHSYPGKDNRKWYWSLPELEFNDSNVRWKTGEPNDAGRNTPVENCGQMDSKQWSDYACKDIFSFICYNETKFNTFHYIDKPMTWPQAQNHCRQHYTDLVSGLDQLDDEAVKNSSSVWIGLFRDTWRWSDGTNSSFRNWQSLEDLVDGQSNKTCATVLNSAGTWSSDYCDQHKPFYCYDDKLILINQTLTWVEALNYCRDNHRDLASIANDDQQRQVQAKAKKASTECVWLGLRYTCTLGFWFWVSNEAVNYQNWASDVTSDYCDMSAVINKGDNKWYKKPDNDRCNFICFV